MAIKTLTYILLGKDALSPVARKAGAETEGAFGRMGVAAGQFSKAAGLATVGVGAGLAVVAGESVRAATSFQSSMEKIHTQAGASQKSVNLLSSEVLNLGKTAEQSPTQLADALYHLKSVGLDDAGAMKALKTASDLAAVGGANLEDTTNALAGAWRSGIKGAQSFGETAATVNAIIGAGNMRMEDFTAAIGTGILPAAKTFGVSLQSVGAALALMTDEGVPAEDAATRLKMSLSLLGAPSGAAEKQLAKIGLTGIQLANAMRGPSGLVGAISLLKAHLDASGMSASEQAALLSRAFGGGRSSSAILTMINNLDVLKKKQDQVNSTMGRYGDAVTAQRKTASAQFDILKSNIDVIGIRIGLALLPPLTAFTGFLSSKVMPVVSDFVTHLLGAFSGTGASGFVGSLVTAFKNLVAVVGPLAKTLMSAIGPVVFTAFRLLASILTGTVAPALASVSGFMKSHATAVQSAAVAIGVLVLALKAQAIWTAITTNASKIASVATKGWAAAMAILNAIMDANPFVLIAVALVALGAAFYYAWTHSATFRDIVIGVWNDVKKAAIAAYNDVLLPIFHGLVTAWDAVTGAFQASVSFVVGVFKAITNFISSNFDPWWAQNGQAIKDIWNGVWQVISTIVKVVWAAIQIDIAAGWLVIHSIFTVMSGIIRAVWSVLWAVLGTTLKIQWAIIQAILKAGWTIVSTLFSIGIAEIVAGWKIFWSVLSNTARVVWAAITAIVKIAWDVIVALFTVTIDLLTGKWGNAWRTMHNLVIQVWNAIKSFIGTALGAFSSVFSTTLSTVVGFFSGLGGRILGAMRGIGSLLTSTGSSIIAGLFSGIKAALSGIVNWVKDNIFNPIVGAVKSLFGIHSPSTVFAGLGGHLMTGFIKGLLTQDISGFIGKVFGGMPQALESLVEKGIVALGSLPGKALNVLGKVGGFFGRLFGGGGGVNQWAATVMQALALNHEPMSLLGQVLHQISTESGGNARAINLTDINAQMGDPSRGLLQTTGATFARYHVAGTSNDIYDPLANIAAAINYAMHAYGPSLMSGGMGLGSGHGYALGTSYAMPGYAWVGENGPELMKFRGGEQVGPVMASRGGRGGNTYYISVAPTPLAHPRDIGREVVGAIQEFERGSGNGWRS